MGLGGGIGSPQIRSAAFIGSSSVEMFNASIVSGTQFVMRNEGFGVWACGFLRQRMMLAWNPVTNNYHFGAAGVNTDVMRTSASLAPAAVTSQPDVVFVYAGMTECATNTATTAAVALTRIQALHDYLVAGGIKKIVIMATGPRNAAAANGSGYFARQQALIAELAAWTSANGILYCDSNPAIQNLATGEWLPGYTLDGVHPSYIGAMELGRSLANWCLANLNLGPEPLTASRIAALRGSNPLNTGGSGGLATNYTRNNAAATTPFLEDATDGGARWQGLTFFNPSNATWTSNVTNITGANVNLADVGISAGQLVRSWVETNFSGGLQRLDFNAAANGTGLPRLSGTFMWGTNVNAGADRPQWPAVNQNLVFAGPVLAIPNDATVIATGAGIGSNMTNVPSTFRFRYLGFEPVSSRATPTIGS